MKVEQFDNNGKDVNQIFGITPERWNECNKFIKRLLIESLISKFKRSEVIAKVIEFANTPTEALVIYSVMGERKGEIEMLKRFLFDGDKSSNSIKCGEISIKNGEIVSMNGDDIPEELVDDLEKIVEQLKSIRPTGNMNVGPDGSLN